MKCLECQEEFSKRELTDGICHECVLYLMEQQMQYNSEIKDGLEANAEPRD